MNTQSKKSQHQGDVSEKPETVETPQTHSNDNWFKRFDLGGFARSFSIGAILLSAGGWVIHSYGIPAMSSVWEEMVRPRINDFMVVEINDYLSGKIVTSKEKPNELGAKLRVLAGLSDRIETISNSLFGSVDSVYPIATEYSLEQIKDKAKNTIRIEPSESATGPIRLHVYADPSQHCIWAFVKASGKLQRGARKENLYLSVKMNNVVLPDGDSVPAFAQEIGKFIKRSQGTGGGGRDEEQDILSTSLSENIQKIEIVPQFPAFDPIQIVGPPDDVPERQTVAVKLDGYILIARRRLDADCRQKSVISSSVNASK